MKVCKNCSKEYEDNINFCPNCGARLEEKEEDLFGDIDFDSFLFGGGKKTPKEPKKEENDEDFLTTLVSDKKRGDKLAERAAHNKERQKKLAQGRSLCIQGKFDEAKKVYDEFINENPEDAGGFIGLVRIKSKDFTVYQGPEIDEGIRQTIRIARTEDFSRIDDEYAKFLFERDELIRKEKEKKKEAARRAAELRRAEEERKRKEEEEKLRKAKEAAERAKAAALKKVKAEEDRKNAVAKARTCCIQKKFDEAKKIYDSFIEDNPNDVIAFIGLVRVASEDYSLFDSKKIENAIKQASKIAKTDNFDSIDKEYAEFLKNRNKYFEDLEEQKRRAEAIQRAAEAKHKAEVLERERKERELEEKRAREEAARKAKEAAEKAKEVAAKKAEEARKKAEEARKKAEEEKRRQEELLRIQEAAFDKKEEEARRGDADAQYYVAQHYYEGNIVKQSYFDAVYWLEKAVKQKHAKAAELLGDCYLYGHGVEYNAKTAKKYYHLAEKYEK